MIETVGVVGLGLIGGSMAKALRVCTNCTLCGYDAVSPATAPSSGRGDW